MRHRRSFLRRAFTLVEILTSLAILGVIGVAFVRLILSQARFTEGQMAMRNARTVSRNAMNILLTDIRMVEDNGGLLAASRDSVTLRVPVAFGLLCANAGGVVTISLLPVDSSTTAMGKYAGWAYRDSATGLFSYKDAGSPVSFGAMLDGVSTTCSDSLLGAPGILPLKYTPVGGSERVGRVITLTDGPSGSPVAGWPVFLYQQITYKFANSSAYPGRIGLFRLVKTDQPLAPMTDEIIAPFDTSAKFRYYVLNADAAVDAPPTDLNTVRGLEFVLAGSSPRAQQGRKAAQQALVTGVFFKNRRDP